jgi:hypothetical protein
MCGLNAGHSSHTRTVARRLLSILLCVSPPHLRHTTHTSLTPAHLPDHHSGKSSHPEKKVQKHHMALAATQRPFVAASRPGRSQALSVRAAAWQKATTSEGGRGRQPRLRLQRRPAVSQRAPHKLILLSLLCARRGRVWVCAESDLKAAGGKQVRVEGRMDGVCVAQHRSLVLRGWPAWHSFTASLRLPWLACHTRWWSWVAARCWWWASTTRCLRSATSARTWACPWSVSVLQAGVHSCHCAYVLTARMAHHGRTA